MNTLEAQPIQKSNSRDSFLMQRTDPVWGDETSIVSKPNNLQGPFGSLRELGLETNLLEVKKILKITESVQMPDFTTRTAIKKTEERILSAQELQDWYELELEPGDVSKKPFDQDDGSNGEKTDQLPVVIVDDREDPTNPLRINDSIIDLPPQWATAIENVMESEAKQDEGDERLPLRARIKTTFKAVLEELDYRLEPTLIPGVEVSEILESPTPLTYKEARIISLNPKRELAAVFLTICLLMQHEAPQVALASERTAPLHPPTPLTVPDGASQFAPSHTAAGVFDQDAEAEKAPEQTIPTLEDWQKAGEFFPKVKTVENEYALAEKAAVLKRFQDNPELIQVYKKAQDATGVPLEFFAGIHHREGNMNINGSFISGRRIGTPEPDAGYRVFGSLAETAIYGGELLKNKSGQEIDTAQKWVKVLSRYNGGGNRNWGRTDYPHEPLFEGFDDPYVMNFFDEQHGGEESEMYVRYCEDGIPNTRGCPRVDYRAGVYAVAIWVHEFIESGQIKV